MYELSKASTIPARVHCSLSLSKVHHWPSPSRSNRSRSDLPIASRRHSPISAAHDNQPNDPPKYTDLTTLLPLVHKFHPV